MTMNQPLRIALVGNPNCGKTALFNRLTGARQKVANYAGVTVERKEGQFTSTAGVHYQVIDLPGAYSLEPMTPDEAITREVLFGARADAALPDVVVLVVDATNLRLNLRLVLEVLRLKRPTVLAVNMMDVAKKRGLVIDIAKLQSELGIPVIETVAIRPNGSTALVTQLDAMVGSLHGRGKAAATREEPVHSGAAAGAQGTHPGLVDSAELSSVLARFASPSSAAQTPGTGKLVAPSGAHADAAELSPEATQAEVRRILNAVIRNAGRAHTVDDRIDAFVLHPVLGYLILTAVLFLIFQAVFSWSKLPMDLIKNGVDGTAAMVRDMMPDGVLKSLVVDGILSGVGSVLVFLPQILILFLFILALEDSGYLPRAAFLLDRLMGSVGLSGRAFIPLLSSFACAVPGIMATRTIQNPRDRLATIMIAPLMTCSARLPVYALIIGAFIPDRSVGIFNLQGLVLFALYVAGIVSAMAVAWVFKRVFHSKNAHTLMLELPNYHWPNLRNLALGLWERARIFTTRVGTIILALMVILWFLSSFPAPPDGATGPAIQYSIAGHLGRLLEVVFAPVGFNWQIAIALIPGLAAREVAVGALGTVYALSATGDALSTTLTPMIAATWSLPTALSLLAWYVFAPQCVSTLSMVRRETNSWKPVAVMAGYMFALAYLGAFATYQISRVLLGGS